MTSSFQAPVPELPSRSADPMLGAVLGDRYTIRRRIGAGGMGLVYLANQDRPPEEVVVKVLAPHWLHDEAAKGRFDREARALSALRHPNIVEMYDFGRENERAYLVMEYLRGIPLSRYLARTPQLPMKEFVPIAAQILKGTGYAHSREIIVRDIKPANVMLCERRGRANFVKMLDFGLAKLVHDDNPITQDQALGTLGFIAPETVTGAAPDLRVDVYALGVLFYSMLSGRLPFDPKSGGSAAMLYKTVNEAPLPLAEALPENHDVPEGFIELVHRCLHKNPDDRPADANVIVEQMIDVVPAAMFRLPSIGRRGGEPASEESLSMPSFAAVSSTKPSPSGPVADSGPAPQSSGNRGGLLLGLAIGGLATAGVIFATQCSPKDEPAPAVASTNDDAPRAVTPTSNEPATADDTPAAETPATAQPAPAEPTAVLGTIEVSSKPSAASVWLDDTLVGVTPYEGKTTVGTHSVRIEAPGFHPWSSQVTVESSAGEPMAVTLVRSASGTKRRQPGGRTRGGGSTSPSSGTQATTSPKPTEPTTPPPASDASLLGGKKHDSSGLLPSKPKGSKSDTLLKGD